MLDGGRKFALVPAADAASAGRGDLRVRRDELVQKFRVFIINIYDIIDAEKTLFWFWLARPLSPTIRGAVRTLPHRMMDSGGRSSLKMEYSRQ